MNDLLRVKGLGRVDGNYEFDIVELLRVDGPEALTSREQHQIRLIAGVRGGEIQDAVFAADAAVMVALAAVLIQRKGKQTDPERLWDARMVYSSGETQPELDGYQQAVSFHFAAREEQEAENGPPAEAPPVKEPSANGGATSSSRSETRANDLSRIGHLV